MTQLQSAVPLRQRPIFNRYVVLWTMLGTLATGYLSVLLFAPDWLDGLFPVSNFSDPQANRGQRAAARLASDISGLRDSVSRIQMDMAKVKTEVEGVVERDRNLANQVTAIEQKLSALPQAPIETTSPPTNGGKSAPQSAKPNTGELIRADARAEAPVTTIATPAQPRVINSPEPVAQTTGEVVDPGTAPASAAASTAVAAAPAAAAGDQAISFGPAVVKPAPKPLGVRLSSAASVDALRLSWSLLADRHGSALKNLVPRYVAAGDAQNPSFDLIAGPIKSGAQAKRLCKTLTDASTPCKVSDFGGDAL